MALRVDMTGNSTGFEQMLNTARTQAKAFSNSVEHEISSSWGGIGKSLAAGIAGAFTIGGLKSGLDWFVNTGKQIQETAEQVDMSTDSWQKWTQAVEDAGLSTTRFMRVVEALHEKRTSALTDPKARGELNRLGFSDTEITGDMDMSTFLQRALANANGGDQQRKYLSDIIGAQGLKFAAAAKNVDAETPTFSDQDTQEAKKIARAETAVTRFFGRIATFALTPVIAQQDAADIKKGNFGPLTEEQEESLTIGKSASAAHADRISRDANFAEIIKIAKSGDFTDLGKFVDTVGAGGGLGFSPQQIAQLQSRLWPELMAKITAPTNAQAAATKAAEDADSLTAQLAAQKEAIALKDKERKYRMEDLATARENSARSRSDSETDRQRGFMTIGDRRASISGELPKLLAEIADRKKNPQDGTADLQKDVDERNEKLKTDDGFLTDANKKELAGITGKDREIKINDFREAFKDATDSLQTEIYSRQNSYASETDRLQARADQDKEGLRQKPLSFNADSMAKVGLYSASALQFNPVLGIQQKANEWLKKIAENTTPKNSVQQPPRNSHTP